MRIRLFHGKMILGLVALAASLALLVTACGGEDPTPTSPPAATSTPTAMAPAAPATPTATPTPLPPGATPPPQPTATPTPQPTSTPTPIPEADRVDFGGKTVRITVGYAPGGGFDTFSRIFASHLSDALEGNPSVIVTNKPGANTLVAVKSVTGKDYRDNQADIVVVISTLVQQSILSGVEGFDAATDLKYLGAPDFTPSDQTWCIRTSLLNDPNNALDEFFAGSFTLGQIGRVDTYATSSEWAVQVGFPFERAFGYTGTSDMNAAFNRGEIDVTPTCRDSEVRNNPEWAEGYATPLFYTIMEPAWIAAGKAEGKWPWADKIANIASGRLGASQAYIDGFNSLMDLAASSRIFGMPSQTPPEVVASVRAAFEQVVSSDAFVADMNARNYDVGLRTGDQYQAQVDGLAALPDETLDIIKGLFPDE